MINQLFGYPLWKGKINLTIPEKKKLIGQIIENYNQNISYTQPRWRCDVFSTYEKFNDNVDYSPVTSQYSDQYVEFSNQFGLFEHQYKITNIWNNVYRKNYFQEIHDHCSYNVAENNFIWFSGVHFLKLGKDHPKLTFHNPGHTPYQVQTFGTVGKTYDPTNLNHSFFGHMCEPPVEEDDIIIFPSSLSHSVGMQKVDDLRITISFNVAIKVNHGDTI